MNKPADKIFCSQWIWIVILIAAVGLNNGCAKFSRKEAKFTYEAYVDEKNFSSRKEPAAISNISDSQLLEKGYIPMGTIKVSHFVDRTYKITPTRKAQIIAAERGGDIIKLSARNEEREEIQKKRSECLETKKQKLEAWQPFESRDEWKDVETCVKWDYSIIRTRIILTQGKVWRYEPNFLKQLSDKILFSAIQDGNDSLVNTLLDSRFVNVHATDNYGWTPLMYVAHYGGPKQIPIAEQLIDKGALVDAKDKSGKTALMKAVFAGHTDMAKLLINKGADVYAEDNYGKNALDFASKDVRAELEKWLENQKE